MCEADEWLYSDSSSLDILGSDSVNQYVCDDRWRSDHSREWLSPKKDIRDIWWEIEVCTAW